MAASIVRRSRIPAALLALVAAGQLGCPGTSLQYRAMRAEKKASDFILGARFGVLIYGELAAPPTPPTVVRIYELADASAAEAIEAASTDELARKLDAEVAPVALGAHTLSVAPREVLTKKYPLHEKTRAVLVAALVRHPSGTSWRYIIPYGALKAGNAPAVMVREDSLKLDSM